MNPEAPKQPVRFGVVLAVMLGVLLVSGGSHFHWSLQDGHSNFDIRLGILSGGAGGMFESLLCVGIVVGIAYFTRQTPAGGADENTLPVHQQILNLLRRLRLSEKDKWLAGICSGLGDCTTAPVWVWRLLFLGFFWMSSGFFLFYIALAICVPKNDEPRRGTWG